MKHYPKLVCAVLIALSYFSCQKENFAPDSLKTSFKGTLSIVEIIEVYDCNPTSMVQSSNEILEMEEFSEDSIRFSVGECTNKVFKINQEQIYISEMIEGAQTKILLHNDSVDFLHRQIINDGKTFKETKWQFVGRKIK